MKKIFVFLFALLAVAAAWAAPAQAFEDWEILSFHSDIDVQTDGTLLVTEIIKVNFNVEKRGIFREIPYVYYDEFRQHKSITIDVTGVENEMGEPWDYVDTYEYDYLNIRIGDPDVYLDGEQTYIIKYKVLRAIGFYDEHDELYWDVTGNDWFVPIGESSATVRVPSDKTTDLKARCFTGEFGSTEEDCTFAQQGNVINFSANDFLTIVVGWPKGVIAEPSAVVRTGWFLRYNFGYLFPLLTLIIMFFVWYKYGNDPEDPPGLVTQFDPPEDLTPAEVGYLMEGKLKKSYLAAELVNLASKGFIHIKEKESKKAWKEDDYILIKKKDFDDKSLKEHEKMILKGVFSGKDERNISTIPTSFYSKVSEIKGQLFKQMKEKKYYNENPQNVKTGYWILAIFLVFISFFTLGAMTSHLFVGLLLSGLVIFIFSFVMPRRTQRGVLAYEHAQGFRQYIDIAEDRRVKWEETQNLFYQYLPYAMVFGLADKWAKAFKDVFKEPPDWYEGDPAGFSTVRFAKTMNVFSATTTSHIKPPASTGGGYTRSGSSGFSSSSSGFSGGSSFGGGGFSGGGFGGGGGGSW